jgi:hypothetical protein
MPQNPYSSLNTPVAPPAPMGTPAAPVAPVTQGGFTPNTQSTYNNLAMGNNAGNIPIGSGNDASNSVSSPVNSYDPSATGGTTSSTSTATGQPQRSAYGTLDAGGNVAGLAGQAAMGDTQFDQFIPDTPKAENEGEYDEFHEAAQDGFEDASGEMYYGKKGAKKKMRQDAEQDSILRYTEKKDAIDAAKDEFADDKAAYKQLSGKEKRKAKKAAKDKKKAAKKSAKKEYKNDRKQDKASRKSAYKSVKADIKMGTTYDDIKLDD